MMGEGTVNDEELVEVIAKRLRQTLTGRPAEISEDYAADLVGVIKDAGFQVYRPEDCKAIDVVDDSGSTDPGTYFLVPADSGGSG